MYLKRLVVTVSALVALGVTQASAETPLSQGSQLRVGATLPLSGDYAFVGQAMQHGMELALKELPKDQIKIWYEDEGVVDRAKAMSGFQKLVSTNAVQVVLGSTTNTVTAYAPTAVRMKIPVISLWDSNASIDSLGDYVFSIGFSTEIAGEIMAEHAYKNLKLGKLAIVSAQNEWSEVITEAFVERYKNLGGEVVIHDEVNVTDSDLRTVVNKIKSSPSQAIYAPLYLSALHAVIRQSRTIGYKGTIMAADGMFEEDAKQLGEAAEGVILTQIWLDSPEFEQKFKAAFPGRNSPIDLSLASLGYDAVKMLSQVLTMLRAESKPVTPKNIRDALPNLDYAGVSTHIKFNGKRSIAQVETLVQVRNGKLEKLQQ